MVLVLCTTRTIVYTKAVGKMDRNLDMVARFILMDLVIQENG
jgi:hypothetical protein